MRIKCDTVGQESPNAALEHRNMLDEQQIAG